MIGFELFYYYYQSSRFIDTAGNNSNQNKYAKKYVIVTALHEFHEISMQELMCQDLCNQNWE